MADLFLHDELWSRMQKLAQNARRRHVAVAYLGTGAADMLPLGHGDVLVVDASLGAIRSGQTSPHEIVKFLKRKVRVYSCTNLHAKVFVFDGAALIGSANVSHRSQDVLLEAGVLTRNIKVVDAARAFVRSLTGELITPTYARKLKKEYKPPRFPGERARRTPALWMHRIHSYDFDVADRKVYSLGDKIAKARLANKKDYDIDHIVYNQSSHGMSEIAVGDQMIQIWHNGSKLAVYSPARVIEIRRYKSGAKKRVMLFLEAPVKHPHISWPQFAKGLKKALGAAKIGSERSIARKVADAQKQRAIRALWKG